MMTNLNGNLDTPENWIEQGIAEDVYKAIVTRYRDIDTILIGENSYAQMVEYWPGAENDGSETNQEMARYQNSYKKYIISNGKTKKQLEWNNSEHTLIHSDEEMVEFIKELKSQTGKDIHLAGGVGLAQSLIRLNLVDEYRLFVYPTVVAGPAWFDKIEDRRDMELGSATTYTGGVVGMFFQPKNR